MQKKFLLHFVLLVFFIKISFALQKTDSITQDIQKARENTHLHFKAQTDLIQHCVQELRLISSQTLLIQNNISKTTNSCHILNTEDQIKGCIDSKKTILEKMKSLAQTISQTQTRCFSIFHHQAALNRMAYSIHSLEKDLMIFQGRYTRWTQRKKENKQDEYQNGPLLCSLDIGFQYRQMIDWDTQIKMASLIGDVYTFNKGISAIAVLNDYIQILAEFCTQEEPDNPFSQKALTLVQEIQNRVQKSQELTDQTMNQADHTNLDQWPKQWCSQWNTTPPQTIKELCQNPLNNPSWTYSAYYFSRFN